MRQSCHTAKRENLGWRRGSLFDHFAPVYVHAYAADVMCFFACDWSIGVFFLGGLPLASEDGQEPPKIHVKHLSLIHGMLDGENPTIHTPFVCPLSTSSSFLVMYKRGPRTVPPVHVGFSCIAVQDEFGSLLSPIYRKLCSLGSTNQVDVKEHAPRFDRILRIDPPSKSGSEYSPHF